MTIRADHVAGGAVLVFGVVVFLLGSDLPFGSLSAPGAGMMPKLVTGLMMLFAVMLIANAAASEPAANIDWSDRGHAGLVVLITAAGIACYTTLGFLVTITLLVFALLVVVERQNVLRAAAYSICLTALAYWLFGVALKSPLEPGLLGL